MKTSGAVLTCVLTIFVSTATAQDTGDAKPDAAKEAQLMPEPTDQPPAPKNPERTEKAENKQQAETKKPGKPGQEKQSKEKKQEQADAAKTKGNKKKPAKPKAPPATGYTDTPLIPDAWRIHDDTRPRPRIVTPGTNSRDGDVGSAPSDAIILFDGKDLSEWISVKTNETAEWTVKDGYFEVTAGQGPIETKRRFGDVQLHVEWASPTEVVSGSQGRGNSGIFLLRKYEVQVLDSFNNVSYADGQAGAIYGQTPPMVNASREPGEWQTYDIIWEAPRFAGKQLIKPAYLTLLHNGVLLHHRRAYKGPTRHKTVPVYEEHDSEMPIQLQDHRNPVRYRNIWIRRLYDIGS